MDGRLFIGFNDTDRVVALDADTGEEGWTSYTDGPVRLPPVAWESKVYVTSDDGFLYCLNSPDGEVVWKRRGGPSDAKVLGNKRLISTWPARGGPVVADGTVYFAAGIWPFMGVFVYALDAESGEVIWCNDRTGSLYVKQPHNSPAFAGLAPQGYLDIGHDNLVEQPGLVDDKMPGAREA